MSPQNELPIMNEGEINEKIFTVVGTYRYGVKRGTRFIHLGKRS